MMRRSSLAVSVLVALVAFFSSPLSGSAIAGDLRTDVLELMELTGAANIGAQMGSAVAQEVLNSLRQARPDIPPRALTIAGQMVDAFIRKGAEGELLEEVVAIYMKYLTHEDVRQLIAFYRTPLGKKLISATPAIVNESMRASQAWAQRSIPALELELRKRLSEEGLLQP